MPPNQADNFPGDPFPHPIPQQPQNPWVSIRVEFRPLVVRDAHSPMCVPPQVPPFPANGQPEVHREDAPPPVWSAAGPGRVRDPDLFDPAYQGVVGYHPQPLVGVSTPHPSATEPSFDQWRLGNRTLHMCSQML